MGDRSALRSETRHNEFSIGAARMLPSSVWPTSQFSTESRRPFARGQVKPAGVVCDDYRVIFSSVRR